MTWDGDRWVTDRAPGSTASSRSALRRIGRRRFRYGLMHEQRALLPVTAKEHGWRDPAQERKWRVFRHCAIIAGAVFVTLR